MWPHFDTAAKRCSQMYGDFKQGLDISKYKTTGTEDKRIVEPKKSVKREDYSPSKQPDQTMSSAK
jgi:hypothetical protein